MNVFIPLVLLLWKTLANRMIIRKLVFCDIEEKEKPERREQQREVMTEGDLEDGWDDPFWHGWRGVVPGEAERRCWGSGSRDVKGTYLICSWPKKPRADHHVTVGRNGDLLRRKEHLKLLGETRWEGRLLALPMRGIAWDPKGCSSTS